ncbi:unnamed protein product [Acanthoscelides obtectus]|uniref:Uncharacterized protein n=1 Tax=Acanthoscelides obtectus TaxID=200917 RepID=A0A9P0LFB3_ACAOB|nr:unnamed protein product [Acanthoscelides obtectus]CAK1648296.1 hypothetical protein AOBTE_LOCUS15658 [Acanthoscelides obtectus]
MLGILGILDGSPIGQTLTVSLERSYTDFVGALT